MFPDPEVHAVCKLSVGSSRLNVRLKLDRLEFLYATARKTPIFIILVGDEVASSAEVAVDEWHAEDWVKDVARGCEVMHVQSAGALGTKNDKGVPKIFQISHKMHEIIDRVPTVIDDDYIRSASLDRLKQVLVAAKGELDELEGGGDFKTCTRCGRKYDDSSSDGCKKHMSYYMGGSLLAG